MSSDFNSVDALAREFKARCRRETFSREGEIKAINVSLKLLKGDSHTLARKKLSEEKEALRGEIQSLSDLDTAIEGYDN